MILDYAGMKSRFLEEKYVHLAFEASLVLKAVFAVAEILTGVGAYFVTQQFLLGMIERITRGSCSKTHVISSPITSSIRRSTSR